tara:strand:- start:4248 stop:6746 length:2499 start_codon:yes stop_codon:yes gene_type:complete
VIFLIDGHSIAFRAFYALPETLETKDGFPTNVIHGFLMMLSKLVNNYEVEKIIIAWDVSKKTFRNEIFDDYKANRSSSPDNFKIQIKKLQSLLVKFNLPQVSLEGYEADDVLGSLASEYNKKNKKVTIVTGDRDSFQLISSKTHVMYTKRGISDVEIYDSNLFTEKYQISTNQYVEYLALKGDKSDNIPGLPGVGEKTAISLLLKYNNILNIYKNLDKLTPKLKTIFEDNEDILQMSKKLAKIKTDLSLQIPNTDLTETIFFDDKVLESAKNDIIKFELNRFLGDRRSTNEKEIKNDKLEIHIIEKNIDLPSIVFSFEDKYYFVNNKEFGEFKTLQNFKKIISLSSQNIFKHHEIKDSKNFVAYDCILFLKDPSIRPDNLINIAKYLDPQSMFNKKSSLEDFIKFFELNIDLIKSEIKEFQLNTSLYQLYKDVDFPMLEILCEMEKIGISVSKEKMIKLSKSLSSKLKNLQKKCFDITEKEFNLNSPKQLSEIFYNELKYPILKKTPKGAPSTDASVLEELAKTHDLPKHILKYRELEKIRSTYVDGLLPEVTNKSKIHTHYNLFGTTTGRLSSEKPNLQNIPNKTELGQQIRDFFVSNPSKKFILSDYSQIELRVLAHLSQDSEMIKILKKEDADIHSETAARIFNQPISEVNSEMRRKAKEVNFGLIYGMEAFGLSKSLDIPQKEAKKLIDAYFDQFPKVKGFLEEVVSNAEKSTYTTTLFGRKRYIRELASSNFQLKAMGRRIAMNAPIQGTASDIMKIAMIKVQFSLNKFEDANLLLQIHDEIVVEANNKELKKVSSVVSENMKNAVKLDVPLYVNTKLNTSLANFNN